MDFQYDCPSRINFFTDTLYQGKPCVFTVPRNHESLFLVTEGFLEYENNGQIQHIGTNCVGYIARGSLDISRSHNGEKVSYIAVNFQYAASSDKETGATLPFSFLCSRNRSGIYRNLFQTAYENQLLKRPGYRTVNRGLLLQIIGLLYQEQFCPLKDPIVQKIEPGITYLTSNYADSQLQIRDAAALCGMTDNHFRKLFRSVHAESPYTFLQNLRIEQAKLLLRNTPGSIEKIAFQCGFSDVYSFSHCFKKHTGLSPGKYRSQKSII